MANKPKITYLLGAGASAFAVPTIKHFQLLLEKFRLEILTKLQKFEVTEIEKQLIDDKLKLIDEISLFATVDTWARKLFLSKDPNYKHVKELISLFLIYSQFGCLDPIGQLLNDQKKLSQSGLNNLTDIEKTQIELMFQRSLDPRYDLFIGSILKHDPANDKLQFPDNINIISWNYDSQFETSYKTFSYSDILRENNEKVEVLKLNGTANFNVVTDKTKTENAFYFHNNIEKNRNYLSKILKTLVERFDDNINVENQLKFAWEMENGTIEKASATITNTDILVIIGYTFPSFNQEIERVIFNSPKKIQKIYFQVPEKEYPSLLERLKGTIYSGLDQPTYNKKSGTVEFATPVDFINIKDLNQFYIPNEFYL